MGGLYASICTFLPSGPFHEPPVSGILFPMKRDDFIFTIGYQGNTAVIDGKTKKKNSGASFRELAEKGLYKAAYCAVLDSNDAALLEEFISFFNSRVPGRPYNREELSRLFGVYGVPEGITRTKLVY